MTVRAPIYISSTPRSRTPFRAFPWLKMVITFIALIGIAGLSVLAGITLSTRTLWSAKDIPKDIAVTDTRSVELGLKFYSKYSGQVLGVRFYKNAENNGTHTGSLWDNNGNQLTTVTFTHESLSGWQTAYFPKPVTIAANVTYIISYHAPAGRYSLTSGYFNKDGHNNGPLVAEKNDSNNPNGVATHSDTTAFPKDNSDGTNYWVDIVFHSSLFSPTANAAPPLSLKAVQSGKSIIVSWSTGISSTPITGYKLYRNGQLIKTLGNVLSYTDTDIQPGVTYEYKIATIDSKDTSPQSNALSIKYDLASPTVSSVSSNGTTSTAPASSAAASAPANGTTSTGTTSATNSTPTGSSSGSGQTTTSTPTPPPVTSPTPPSSVSHGSQITTSNTGYAAWVGSQGQSCTTTSQLKVYTSTVSSSSLGSSATCVWLKGGITINSPITLTASRIDDVVDTQGYAVTLNYCTVQPPSPGDWSLGPSNFTATRSQILGSSDGVRYGGSTKDTLIENYIRVKAQSSADHNDGIQMYGASGGGTILRNNIDDRPVGGGGGPNGAIFIADGATGTYEIRNNYLMGGAYSLRLHDSGYYRVTGNIVVKGTYVYGPVTTTNAIQGAFLEWSNNTLSDGTVLTP